MIEEYGWKKAGYDWSAKEDKFEIKTWSPPYLSLSKEEANELYILLGSWVYGLSPIDHKTES